VTTDDAFVHLGCGTLQLVSLIAPTICTHILWPLLSPPISQYTAAITLHSSTTTDGLSP